MLFSMQMPQKEESYPPINTRVFARLMDIEQINLIGDYEMIQGLFDAME